LYSVLFALQTNFPSQVSLSTQKVAPGNDPDLAKKRMSLKVAEIINTESSPSHPVSEQNGKIEP